MGVTVEGVKIKPRDDETRKDLKGVKDAVKGLLGD